MRLCIHTIAGGTAYTLMGGDPHVGIFVGVIMGLSKGPTGFCAFCFSRDLRSRGTGMKKIIRFRSNQVAVLS